MRFDKNPPDSVLARDEVPVVDGVVPGALAVPESPREVADLLLGAAERGLAVAPIGGGTALALGNRPERLDLALSTARLGGIIDYTPTDLVLSVGAGARLGDVQAVLAEHGQGLPIDPPGGEGATIGGLIATAVTGPRRLGSGSLRDLLIGISVAHPSGTVTKAGGMVVKNVSGFDLPRLYHGSLGSLGVVVSANFKVLPLPRAEATVVGSHLNLDAALAAARRVRASRVLPSALEAAMLEGQATSAVRIEGRDAAVRAAAEEVRSLLAADAKTVEGTESAAWWRRYVDRLRLEAGPDEAVLRGSVRPRQTDTLAAGLAAALPAGGGTITFLGASVGLGTVVVRVRWPDGSVARLIQAHDATRGLADHATILAAPPAWKDGIDVWGDPPTGFDLMRALKEQFDPHRVLNPGRFVGFL